MIHSLVFRSALLGMLTISQIGCPAIVVAQTHSFGSGTVNPSEKGALGMVVNYNDQRHLFVTRVVPGGPAALENIAIGDELLAVGSTPVESLPPEQIYQMLMGAPGTHISLSFQSPSRGSYTVTLMRVSAAQLEKSSDYKLGYQDNRSNISPAQPRSATPTASNPADSSWKTYGGQDQGFTIDCPAGWSFVRDEKTGRLEVSSPSSCKLSIFPFYIPSQSIKTASAAGIFTALLKQYAPGATWTAPDVVTGALRSTSMSNGRFSIAGLALSPGGEGTAGQLIIFGSPTTPQGQADVITLGRVLQSFQITGIASSGIQNNGGNDTDVANGQIATGVAVPDIQYTQFTDPNFGAFSLDVPSGWNVTGGLTKPMPIDLRPWVKAVSPDQKMAVFIGDGSIEPRYLPAMWLTRIGCPPGSIYKHSNGMVSRVLFYQDAEKFVKDYAKSRFGKNCDSFEFVNVEHHPELAREINGTQGVVACDAASARYEFSAKGTHGTAFFMAATKKGSTMWWVSQICGVVAADGYEQAALQIFQRMYKSWQYNPDWEQGQARQNVQSVQNWLAFDRAARARSAAAFSARMAAMDARHNSFMNRMRDMDASHARYMNSMRSSDRAHSDFVNYIRDEETLMNPTTGEKFQVEYGPKYHWVNSTGDTVLSTDSAWGPGVNWTELVTPPKP
jgi:hypothetical protein